MAVLSVKEDWRELGADFGKEEASTTRKFTVLFDTGDNPVDRPGIAALASGIPHIWETHPNSPWLFVSSIRTKAIGPLFYGVIVSYSTLPLLRRESNYDPTAGPLDQPWEVEWGSCVSNEQIDRDINGNPLTNSAKELFDPPLSRDKRDLILKIQRNEASYNPLLASSYFDAINSDIFLEVFGPEQVKCNDWVGKRARSASLFYWVVNYEFQMRADTWKQRVLDAGYREWNLTASPAKYIPITITDDETGKQVAVREPWPLMECGVAFPEQHVYDGGALHWCEFDIYQKKLFSILGF